MSVNVIFLNGPSSSGKTTLSRYIQEVAGEYYMHIGIDQMIEMMPRKTNDYYDELPPTDGFYWKKSVDEQGHTLANIQLGPLAQQVSQTFKKLVVCMANAGHHIIIDEVCWEDGAFQQWQDLLKPFNAVFVGVVTPLDILEQREKSRGDRMIGSTRAQYCHVHLNKSYDLEIDTASQTSEECASLIFQHLKQRRMESNG